MFGRTIPILVAVVVLTSGVSAGLHAQTEAPAPAQVGEEIDAEVADHEYGCELLADRMLGVTGEDIQENPDLECEDHNEDTNVSEYEAAPPQTIETPRIGPSFVTTPDLVDELNETETDEVEAEENETTNMSGPPVVVVVVSIENADGDDSDDDPEVTVIRTADADQDGEDRSEEQGTGQNQEAEEQINSFVVSELNRTYSDSDEAELQEAFASEFDTAEDHEVEVEIENDTVEVDVDVDDYERNLSATDNQIELALSSGLSEQYINAEDIEVEVDIDENDEFEVEINIEKQDSDSSNPGSDSGSSESDSDDSDGDDSDGDDSDSDDSDGDDDDDDTDDNDSDN